jgi:hypothetical protein
MMAALERIAERLEEEYRQTCAAAERLRQRRRELEEEMPAVARALDFWRKQP